MNQTNKLAILIPTIDGREWYLDRLLSILLPQCGDFVKRTESITDKCMVDIREFKNIFVIIAKDKGHLNGGMSIGAKRNLLTNIAVAFWCSHRAFIDCDDTVSEKYIELNMPGVYGDYDCNSLVGIYSVNGHTDPNKHIFLHSLKYTHWYEDDKFYYRNPNHLNVVKLSLIKGILFQDKSDGEDGCWSEDIAKAGVLKTEYEITEPFYNYLFRTKTNGI